MLIDTHTHNLQAGPDAIIAIGPDDQLLADRHYSIGLHPWKADEASSIQAIMPTATDPRVVAIGETGLDRLRGASLPVQQRLLLEHIELSEQLEKPLILHSVRTAEEILHLHRQLQPCMPWIIHGFRGKPETARRLLRSGIYLSLGARFNHETAAIIPTDRLLIETDDDPAVKIEDVAAAVAAARSTSPEVIILQASANLRNLLRRDK